MIFRYSLDRSVQWAHPSDGVKEIHKLSRYEFNNRTRTIQRKDILGYMALPSSLTQDLTTQDKRKMAVIVLTMAIGLPAYAVLMSIAGITDVPLTASFLGFTSIIGVLMSLLVMMPAYLLGNKITP